MTGEREASRLARIYDSYHRDPSVAARWNQANPGNQTIERERREAILRLMTRHGLWPPHGYKVLDVGCGTGNVLARFREWGSSTAELVGVDVLSDRVTEARAANPDLGFVRADAAALPFPDASFRLALTFTTFSSIPAKGVMGAVAAEIDRVLAPGGAVLWYDIRVANPRNPHTVALGARAIGRLFPGYRLNLRSLTVLPPLARRLGPVTTAAYPVLARLPFLRTHYLGLLTKPGAAVAI